VKQLDGKLVLVTGAASGIGRAAAARFSREGARVAAVDVDSEGLATLARELEPAGGSVQCYVTDLRDAGEVAGLKEEILCNAGTPDIIVNSAGVGIICCVEEVSLEDWHWVIDLNLWGYVNVVNAFLSEMFVRGSGHIVNVASAAGLFAVPYQAPYNTSKYAVMGLTDSIRQEGRRRGVSATAVCPGAVVTPIIGSAKLLGFDEAATGLAYSFGTTPERLAEEIVKGVRKDRPVVMYPHYVRVLHAIKRVSPRLADVAGAAVAKTFYRRYRKA